MSFVIMGKVWEASDLAGDELVLMLALADQANDDGVCWPSVRRLAARCRRSERWVQYRVRELVEKGYVAVEKRGGEEGERQRSNVYRILIALPQEGANRAPGGADGAPTWGANDAPEGAHSVHRGGARMRAPLESSIEPSTTTPQPPASGGRDLSVIVDAAVRETCARRKIGRLRATDRHLLADRASTLIERFPSAPDTLLVAAVLGDPAPNLNLYRSASP